MINHITKFFLLFVFIILFLSFKNQIKIVENDLIYLKKNYLKTHQNFVKKEILLTKQINELQNIMLRIKKLLNLTEMNLMTLQL